MEIPSYTVSPMAGAIVKVLSPHIKDKQAAILDLVNAAQELQETKIEQRWNRGEKWQVKRMNTRITVTRKLLFTVADMIDNAMEKQDGYKSSDI